MSCDHSTWPGTSAAASLLEICNDMREHHEVVRRLTKSSTSRRRTLRSLACLTDIECKAFNRTHPPPTSSAARLLDLIINEPKVIHSLSIYLRDTTVVDGAAGVRYLLRRWTTHLHALESMGPVILAYVDRILNRNVSITPDRDSTAEHAIRLLELILQMGMLNGEDIQETASLHLKLSLLRGGPAKIATLHLIRASSHSLPPGLLDDDLISSLVWQTSSAKQDPELQPLYFLALSVVLKHRPVPSGLDQTRLAELCVETIMNTPYRVPEVSEDVTVSPPVAPYPVSETTNMICSQESWDVSPIVPSADAISILLSFPASSYTLLFSAYFRTTPATHTVLDPVISLIQSCSIDPVPTLLAALVEAGIMQYLTGVATFPIPRMDHELFETIHKAKEDALRAMAQVIAQAACLDLESIVDFGLMGELELLNYDEDEPPDLRKLAQETLDSWSR